MCGGGIVEGVARQQDWRAQVARLVFQTGADGIGVHGVRCKTVARANAAHFGERWNGGDACCTCIGDGVAARIKTEAVAGHGRDGCTGGSGLRITGAELLIPSLVGPDLAVKVATIGSMPQSLLGVPVVVGCGFVAVGSQNAIHIDVGAASAHGEHQSVQRAIQQVQTGGVEDFAAPDVGADVAIAGDPQASVIAAAALHRKQAATHGGLENDFTADVGLGFVECEVDITLTGEAQRRVIAHPGQGVEVHITVVLVGLADDDGRQYRSGGVGGVQIELVAHLCFIGQGGPQGRLPVAGDAVAAEATVVAIHDLDAGGALRQPVHCDGAGR